VISIVDHHAPSEIALKQDVSKTIEIVGSSVALVAQKINGLGIDIPREFARVLYGATLMDTENRSALKMTPKDILIMDDLKEIAGVESDDRFYRDLMGYLLDTDYAELLFKRDYKEDWAFFGFAVCKVKGVFANDGKVLREDVLRKLLLLAERNNADKNLPLTLVKVVDYEEDNETINRERIYLIFSDRAIPEFKEAVFRLLTAIIGRTFKGRVQTRQGGSYIEFWGTGEQLSRKRTAPLLEPIVSAYNEYFYSPSTDLFVKRDFLKVTKRVREAAKKCGIRIFHDAKERVNNLTYGEAVRLLQELGFTAMSLREYWNVLRDANDVRDRQMTESLTSGGFVEFLHTVIEDKRYLLDKPSIESRKGSFEYEGVRVEVDYDYEGERRQTIVPEGAPGLIHSKDIDLETGLPRVVQPPNIYDNPELWRYWSPDAQKNVATRSHIFLLGKPALDLKVHLSEGFDCLGIRPCVQKVELPTIEIITDEEGVTLEIAKEGEVTRVREKEFFFRSAE
jgi:hypothetical protein